MNPTVWAVVETNKSPPHAELSAFREEFIAWRHVAERIRRLLPTVHWHPVHGSGYVEAIRHRIVREDIQSALVMFNANTDVWLRVEEVGVR